VYVEEVCVVSDDRKKLVTPADARWWMHLSDLRQA